MVQILKIESQVLKIKFMIKFYTNNHEFWYFIHLLTQNGWKDMNF